MLGGRCVNELAGYRCVCPPGRSGARCQLDQDACILLQPCLHGARCVDGPGESFQCRCRRGYYGSLCQFFADDLPCSTHSDAEQTCPAGAVCVAGRSADGDFHFRCKFPVRVDVTDDRGVSSAPVTSSDALMTSYGDVVMGRVRVARWQAVMTACVVGAALTTFFLNVLIVVGVRRRRRDVIAGISRGRRRRDDVIGWGSHGDAGAMNNVLAAGCVNKSNAVKPRRLSEPHEIQRNYNPSVGRGYLSSHLPHHVNDCRF